MGEQRAKLPKGVAGYTDALPQSPGQGRRVTRKEQDDVLSYHQLPHQSRRRVKEEEDPVYQETIRGAKWERPLYQGPKDLEGAWFYESDEVAKEAEMLGSMKSVSKGILFFPQESKRENGERLLGVLAQVLKPSGLRVPQGSTREKMEREKGEEWPLKVPLKKQERDGSMKVLCLEVSPKKVDGHEIDGGVVLSMHPMGYIMVLLGYKKMVVPNARLSPSKGVIRGRKRQLEVNKWEGVWEVAHRVVQWCYEGMGGEGEDGGEGEVVMHTCHNKGCVCIAHLVKGSQGENVKGEVVRAVGAREASMWKAPV